MYCSRKIVTGKQETNVEILPGSYKIGIESVDLGLKKQSNGFIQHVLNV
jgi:hypothetical protein